MTQKKLPIVEAEYSPDQINFAKGIPGFSILPTAEIAQATREFAQREDPDYLTYGHYTGNGYFRQAIANFLTEHYRFPVDMDSLTVTNGNSHSLDLICSLFARPGDTILVEELTYFLAIQIFKIHGLRPIAVRMKEDGLDLDHLEEILKREATPPAFLYTIPAFNNPTGVNLSLAHKRRMIELAERYRFKIYADEVYQQLYYKERPPDSFGRFCESDAVIAAGTFSKILAPGLRVGWVQGSEKTIHAFNHSGVAVSAGAVTHYMTGPLLTALENGLQERYLTKLKQVLSHRLELMDEGIKAHFPAEVQYTKPEGGYFFWLRFREGLDMADYLAGAEAAGVGFTPGKFCSVNREHKNCMRLSFAFYPEEDIVRGIEGLGRYLKKVVGRPMSR